MMNQKTPVRESVLAQGFTLSSSKRDSLVERREVAWLKRVILGCHAEKMVVKGDITIWIQVDETGLTQGEHALNTAGTARVDLDTVSVRRTRREWCLPYLLP